MLNCSIRNDCFLPYFVLENIPHEAQFPQLITFARHRRETLTRSFSERLRFQSVPDRVIAVSAGSSEIGGSVHVGSEGVRMVIADLNVAEGQPKAASIEPGGCAAALSVELQPVPALI